MFGLPLCLPGPLLDLPKAEDQTLAHRFKEMMSRVSLRPLVSTNCKQLPPTMAWAYLQVDCHKPALAQLYEGPYQVLRQMRNTATLQMDPRTDTVNLECLKPYIGYETPVPATPQPQGQPRKQPPGGSPVEGFSSRPRPSSTS